MSKYLKFIFILPFMLALLIPSGVYARQMRVFSSLPRTETVEKDYFSAGDKVDLSGVVNGDAYLAGGAININGTVNGDLLVVGGTVTVNGEVTQNVRVLGGNIILNGKIGRNLAVAGGNINIGKSANIGGSLTGAFGNLEYYGNTASDMTLAGGSIDLNGQIGRNVELKAGQLTLGSSTKISGNLDYQAQEKAEIAQDAIVIGKTTFTPVNNTSFYQNIDTKEVTKNVVTGWAKARAGFSILGFVSSLIIGLLVLKFFPRRMLRKNEILTQKLWQSMGIGFLAIITFPLIVLLLMVTVIGIPLSFLLLALWLAVIYMAKIWIGFCLGVWCFKKLNFGESKGWAMVAGLMIYYILAFIPVFGWFFKMFSLFAGVGVFYIEIVEVYKLISAKKIV